MSFQHILAAIDDVVSPAAVIKKAVILAQKSHASLTVLKIKRTHNFNLSLFFQKHNPENKEKKRSPLQTYPDKEQPIVIKECQSHSIHNAIVNECKQLPYDLIIVSHKFYPPFFSDFLIADEWLLLRMPAIPVLFVNLDDWDENRHILTALELDNETISHTIFNKTLIEESKQVAKILSNDLHLIHSYLPDPFYMSFNTPPATPLISERDKYREKLTNVARYHHLDTKNIHVVEGLPEDSISTEAKKLNANIVVMGSAEHKGVFSLLKGNASRNIINQLKTDLYIVKPKLKH